MGDIYDFGLHENNDEDTFEMCVNDDYMQSCKPDNPAFLDKLFSSKGQTQYTF